MNIAITLSDYRCFSAERPATIELRPGRQAFVGLNNTGKSALLRMVYELRGLWATLSNQGNLVEILNSRQGIALHTPTRQHNGSVRGAIASRSKANEACVRIQVSEEGGHSDELELRIGPEGGVRAQLNREVVVPPRHWISNGEGIVRTEGPGSALAQHDIRAICAACRQLHDAFYLPSTRFVAAGGTAGQHWFDINLGSMFITELRGLEVSTNSAHASRFEAVVRELGEILQLRNLQIRPIPDNNRYEIELSVDEVRRKLDEFGAGISQFIMAAMSLALRRPTFVLVDEPEANLHPALQAKYIDLLSSHATVGTLFATHSLGLARHTCEKVWIVRRDEGLGASIVEPLDHPNTPLELLRDLQYGALASVGMNPVLLVEGPADADVARQWLRALGKDTKIMVVQLGGRSLVRGDTARHLDEFKRAGVPVSVFVDSERPSATDQPIKEVAEFAAVCNELRLPCHVSERRSIENYIPKRALDSAFPDKNYRELNPYEHPREGGWKHEPFWLAAREMTRAEVLDTDIGRFLERIC